MTKGKEGVSQFLIFFPDKGEGVGQFLIWADKGGRGGRSAPPHLEASQDNKKTPIKYGSFPSLGEACQIYSQYCELEIKLKKKIFRGLWFNKT